MYTKEDFKKCFFNPFDKALMDNPRVLRLIPADVNDILTDDVERVVRYVVALYDPKSPLTRDYPDLNTRKIAAAGIVGYDLDKDAEATELLFSCDSEFLVMIIGNYLRYVVKSRVWAAINADEQTFWEFVMRLMLPITRGDKDKDLIAAAAVKTKLSADKEDINDRLERNWSRFLGDDEQLIKKMESIDYTPESYAGG